MPAPSRRILAQFLLLGVTGAAAGIALSGLSAGRSGSKPDLPAALDLKFEDAQGSTVRLADFRGKFILLNVWATWCAPCRKEMPSLDRLQAAMGSSRFEVVPLSIDRGGLDAVRPFFAEIGIQNLGIYLDQRGAIMVAAALRGLPTTILVDASGREVRRWVGPKEWDSAEAINEIRANLEAEGTPPSAAATPSS